MRTLLHRLRVRVPLRNRRFDEDLLEEPRVHEQRVIARNDTRWVGPSVDKYRCAREHVKSLFEMTLSED